MRPFRVKKPSLVLVRGLPGSGKSTFADNFFAARRFLVSADMFFEDDDGNYNFDPRQLQEAHAWCLEMATKALADGVPNATLQPLVVVANTFSCRWEMQPYFDMAKQREYGVTVIDLFDAGLDDVALAWRNIHGVPEGAITRMRSRWEHDWRKGNPVAPWER